MGIPFIDLQAQRAIIDAKINNAVREVIESGAYVMGPQVGAFEKQLQDFTGAAHAYGCANGTDALTLAMMALGVGPGDAVFCPGFTFCATSEPVPLLGATPVFVDIRPDTYNIDIDKLEEAIDAVEAEGQLKPKTIIAVCLFGQAAEYPQLAAIAKQRGLTLIADSAQGFGATINGKHPTQWADVATTSFFPAKPLGCYGDGGAVYTNNAAIGELIGSLRIHGQASEREVKERAFSHQSKYLNARIGINSRLDTIQAAILIEKLAIFKNEIIDREKIAQRYTGALNNLVEQTPFVLDGYHSVWAQYTIEVPDRDDFQAHMKENGVPTAVYYPIPLHRQPCYAGVGRTYSDLSVCADKSEKVVSLPMHAYLNNDTQQKIIDAIGAFFDERR
ncbi:MAG: DegT/DnrJ/EryC1/StrS aminotransferase family protein [Pseudomonadota bacterium]